MGILFYAVLIGIVIATLWIFWPIILVFGAGIGALYLWSMFPELKEKFMKLGEFTRWIIGITCGCLIVGALMIVSQVREPAMETRSMASMSHVVYKTYTGKCYHRKSCGYLRSCIETTEAKAREEGLYPCSRCNP